MPYKPTKICKKADCHNKTKDRSGYCSNHKRLDCGWSRTTANKTPTQRGYGYQWQKTRKERLEIDKYLCQYCLEKGKITTATEVDHVIPKSEGGDDSMKNLKSSCNPCHKAKTKRENQKKFSKMSKGGGGHKPQ